MSQAILYEEAVTMASVAQNRKSPTHKKPLDKAYASFSTEMLGAQVLAKRLKSRAFEYKSGEERHFH